MLNRKVITANAQPQFVFALRYCTPDLEPTRALPWALYCQNMSAFGMRFPVSEERTLPIHVRAPPVKSLLVGHDDCRHR